jgi:hypothetical protein
VVKEENRRKIIREELIFAAILLALLLITGCRLDASKFSYVDIFREGLAHILFSNTNKMIY